MSFKNFVLDLLFPIQCLGCGQEGNFICPACFEKIPLEQKIIYFKKSPLIGSIIASSYKSPLLKEAIHKYKYSFVKGLAKPLGQLMIKASQEQPWLMSGKVVFVPVPLHQKRLRWRGFNQAELLAQETGQALNIPLINDVLKRAKHGAPQAQIKNSQEREKNVKEVFGLRRPLTANLQHSTIVLVDDVSTTGATLKECARVLKKAGAQKIWGLVLAKG